MKSVRDILVEVHDYFQSNPENWKQIDDVCSVAKVNTENSPYFTIDGAIGKFSGYNCLTYENREVFMKTNKILNNIVRTEYGETDLYTFNNKLSTTIEDIYNILEKAIKKCQN